MRETYRKATARVKRTQWVPDVRIAHHARRNYTSKEMPDIFSARRMLRRLVRLMVRAGWTMSRAYVVSFGEGGATVTAEMTRADDVCRVSVDGGWNSWRATAGQSARDFVCGGAR